jgi:hypothetical protein
MKEAKQTREQLQNGRFPLDTSQTCRRHLVQKCGCRGLTGRLLPHAEALTYTSCAFLRAFTKPTDLNQGSSLLGC